MTHYILLVRKYFKNYKYILQLYLFRENNSVLMDMLYGQLSAFHKINNINVFTSLFQYIVLCWLLLQVNHGAMLMLLFNIMCLHSGYYVAALP